MNQFGTQKEALLVEAIGDFGKLLDRVELLQSALIRSSQALVAAQARLTDQLAAFDGHVVALTENAKVVAVKHIAARTDEAARRSVDMQIRAMGEAARDLFKEELTPALQRLAMQLQQVVKRVDRPWEQWLTHAAAAATASAATWALVLYLGPR